jgi:hypothetical protein
MEEIHILVLGDFTPKENTSLELLISYLGLLNLLEW